MKANELRIGNYVYDRHGKELEKIRPLWVTYQKYWERHDDKKCLKPIPLTEEWLLKFGFEDWGNGTQWVNEHESYKRYVLHNVLDGTSNFEVHYVKSTYGDSNHYQYIISCDEDDRINWGEDIKHVHQLQNLYFALTNNELKIKL